MEWEITVFDDICICIFWGDWRMRNKIWEEQLIQEAEKIKEELSKIDFEAEYGLTPKRMKEIKERIYRNILKEIERRNQYKS